MEHFSVSPYLNHSRQYPFLSNIINCDSTSVALVFSFKPLYTISKHILSHLLTHCGFNDVVK